MRYSKMARILILAAALLGESTVFAVTSKTSRRLEPFDIKKAPTTADWRYFIKSSDADRERLWTYHHRRGAELGGWTWGWRLGWVRVCGTSTSPLCGEILHQALFDKALVVRAEAVSRYGRRFEGTADDTVIKLLAEAYRNPRNNRHGKPLFIQQRILFALHLIGGDQARAQATRLASNNPASRAYWARLTGEGG